MNSNKRKNGKYGRRRIRKRRRGGNMKMLNSKPYSLKQGIVRLGPGTTVNRITLRYDYTAQTGVSTVTNFMREAQTSVEFLRYANMFNYYKLIGVKIMIPPRISEYRTEDITGRIAIDWTTTAAENVSFDDSAKEIAAYSTTYHTYRFAPPNAILTDSEGRRINYQDWIAMSDLIQLPGSLKITCNFNFSMVVEVIMIFKGNQTEIGSERIKIGKREEKRIKIEGEKLEEKKEEEKIKEGIEEKEKDESKIEKGEGKLKDPDGILNVEYKDEEEEDVWYRDPHEDRKPRWSKEKKKAIKLMKDLEIKMNEIDELRDQLDKTKIEDQ